MSTTYISASLRRQILERAADCCEYCHIHQSDQFFTFEIDHIIAEKHGGVTQADNLCLACADCNAFKGSDVASVDWEDDAKIVGLYHPRLHQWNTHFRIIQETGEIEPLTPEARVTIRLLRINDPERVTDRKLLIDAGRYPCENRHNDLMT